MILMRYIGGLGNQLFQYAMMRSIAIEKGEEALCDLRPLQSGLRRFELLEAFSGVKINCPDENQLKSFDGMISGRSFVKKVLSHIRPDRDTFIHENESFMYNKRYLDFKNGVMEGYWQSERYFANIRDVLLEELTFNKVDGIEGLERKIINDDKSVSVHIRRTDYLNGANEYGGICTEKYYCTAAELMKSKIGECNFYVFSDDINWCKENLKGQNYIFVDNQNVPNWSDMYLMSMCRHNIIANSTFSWWGAWLNKNSDKIVIQPQKWNHVHPNMDIHVDDWISLEG